MRRCTMAKPIREGTGWAFRLRAHGQDIYQSGFASQAAANKAQAKLLAELKLKDQAAGQGPFKTTVAAAFMHYARERLPYLKGARPDSLIINRYLRTLNMPVIRLTPADDHNSGKKGSVYWEVSFVVEEYTRAIPQSLAKHRSAQEARAEKVDEARRRLAAMPMAQVTAHAVQALIDARRAAGYKAAPIANERAELRRLFNHARNRWNWTRPLSNPATHLDMPEPDPPRDSILTNAQWENLSVALCQAGNEYAPSLFCLMLETAMRSCEPLTTARWRHINWTRNILTLPDAKSGGRDVPLGPDAIKILRQLETHAKTKRRKPDQAPWSIDDPIFPTTYEAVKKAWAVARKTCNAGDTPIGDLGIHDLRHTSATRYALHFKGDLPVIMQITGHKTTEMAMRYINIKADTVAHMLHGREPDIADSPAGYRASTVQALDKAQLALEEAKKQTSVAPLRRLPRPHLSNNVVPLHTQRSAA
ncbi:hypothetical protein CKA81_11865 [Pollutimonas thiosulfatoxidans]|uniref:Tyr recombinase domain-containing protein n=2 Tax=Pollutimonas thiosulfatoxidans TaxID=2028345 RepID=A0A410GDU6_9BURK|nr:hypothetical protein CKA81_11865 [Pollutimonas thiosulfatoxidans]